MSLGAGQEERDVSSLGLTADSCIFQLSVLETLSESVTEREFVTELAGFKRTDPRGMGQI